jgi:dephospho-CoA kinase
MRILGLTGSIGMGKTVAARLLRRQGVPVHDADAEVHRLLGRNGAAVSAVAAAFPGTVKDGVIDRKALGAQVFGGQKQSDLRRLERIVHPLVRQATGRWLATQARRRAPVVILDVPLLFESSGAARYDGVIVVTAPAFLQRQRVLLRPGMTEARFADIVRKQLPDRLKRVRADAVVASGLGQRVTLRGLRRALRRLTAKRAWRPGYVR